MSLPMVDEWLANIRTTRSKNTHKTYKQAIKRAERFVEKSGMKVSEVIPVAFLEDFRDYMRAHENVKARTINTTIASVRSYLRWAKRHGVEVDGIYTPDREKMLDARHRRLTRKEVSYFFQMLAVSELVYAQRAALALGLGSGLRPFELVKLEFTDIQRDEETKMMIVNVTEGKGGKNRIAPVLRDAEKFVLSYLMKRSSNKSKWLFPSKINKTHHVSKRSYEKWAEKFSDYIEIDFCAYDLRRTYASLLSTSGISSLQVAKALGHSSLATTDIYVGIDISHINEKTGGMEI